MFSRGLVVCQLPGYRWEVYKEFQCTNEFVDVVVPKGYVTDLASIPRALWWFMPPAGRHAQACVVHDFMYDNAISTKELADKGFHAGLLELGIPRWRAYAMYLAVKWFGKGAYVK